MNIPVYQRIKDILNEEINQGKYKPGDILPSVNQLAKMFSTSRNTAVKAITDLAQEGTIHCIQGKGSVVNDLHSGNTSIKRRKRERNAIPDIGILIADFDNLDHPYFTKLLKGISIGTKNIPCNLKTFCVNNYAIEDFIANENFDGLIVATRLPESSVLLLKQNEIPFVLANNDIYGEDLLCVTIDSYSVTYEAIKYLNSLGHKRITVLSGPSYARSTPGSYLAYQHAVKKLNLEVDKNLFKSCDYGEEAGYKALYELLRLPEIPTAVFAIEDDIAIGVIRAAEENSLRVPEDLSVMGSGDRYSCSNMKIPLTTFSDKLEELGSLCIKMLDSQLNNKVIKHPKINLKPELVIRESCSRI